LNHPQAVLACVGFNQGSLPSANIQRINRGDSDPSLLTLYQPGKDFLSVSVTGTSCALDCAHCHGMFLKHMASATAPGKLFELAREMDANGGIGMLVSGGCDSEGKVPLDGFHDVLAQIGDETDLITNLHTGMVDSDDISSIKKAGVDIVSIDVCGSPEAMKNVYGLAADPWDHEALMSRLEDAEINYIPHITVGLDAGKPSGEMLAIDMIACFNPRMVVFNALMRTPGHDSSRLEDADYFSRVLEYASSVFSDDIIIGIGCMRPRDMALPFDLIKNGRIKAIAMPSKQLMSRLASEGIEFRQRNGCCALDSLDA